MEQYISAKNKKFYEFDHGVGGKHEPHDKFQYGFTKDKIYNYSRYLVTYKTQLEKIAGFVDEVGGDILDLGCGDATILQKIKNFKSYTGVELSSTRIKGNREKYSNDTRCLFIEEDIIDYDKKDNKQYDIILLNEIIEHVPDPGLLLKMVYNLLKSDGVLILSTPVESKHIEGIGNVYRDQHLRVYSARSILKQLKQSQFQIMNVTAAGFQLTYSITMLKDNPILKIYYGLFRKQYEKYRKVYIRKLRPYGILDNESINNRYDKDAEYVIKQLEPKLFVLENFASKFPLFAEQIIIKAKKS